jgi:thiamine biosynthesis lipoprotein
MAASASWTVWGLEASVTVTTPGALPAAEAIVRRNLADIDDACSRFRGDSELALLGPHLAAGAHVSQMLALLVERALDAARWTDGDVDPTLGRDLEALGYDRDIVSVRLLSGSGPGESASPAGPRIPREAPGWTRVSIDGRTLKVPADIRLDLGATAKAIAADRAAHHVYTELGCGVLVCLGGDLATAGPAPDGGWQVLVQDLVGDPAQQVSLGAGFAMATSSTQKRRWEHAGAQVHHILDPRFGLPAETVWRSVTVAAPTCLEANAFSTAGVVRGYRAVGWFRDRGIAGRFVDQQGRTTVTGGWPSEQRATSGGQHRG